MKISMEMAYFWENVQKEIVSQVQNKILFQNEWVRSHSLNPHVQCEHFPPDISYSGSFLTA